MSCPSKFTPALGSPDKRQAFRIPAHLRIHTNAEFLVKGQGSVTSTNSVQSTPVLVYTNSRGLKFHVCKSLRENQALPANLSLGSQSQVGNCKSVLVIHIITNDGINQHSVEAD